MSLLHKKEKQNKNNDQLIRLMTPTIAGILVCTFCLVSMTWAWFTASVNTPTQTIQAATQFTKVKVYEVVKSENENDAETRTLVKPTEDSKTASEEVSLIEELETDKDISIVTAEEPLVWELSPEKTYEVVMTGSGTASTGYCKIALSHTVSGNDTPETKLYQTSNFEKEHTVKFTYNTGGFSKEEGVTETEWKKYVEKTTPPTLTIASYWGEPLEESEVSLMSLRGEAKEKFMLLSDGDVIGLTPIPCPEAKAETEVELEGFEIQEGTEISAEEDYKVSLTLKEGYEMPSEVVVNIDGKDYVVSTGGAEASDDAPYYDTQTGVLTVPSALLSDGIKVSVKATATQIPVEEETEEEETEEATEETTEEETPEEKSDETTEETTDKTETTDDNETEEDNSADTSSSNNVAIDNPNKKEDDGEEDNDEPVKTPTGDGGNDDEDDEADNNSGSSSNGNASSSGNNKEETEEKADVTLNLSQLTINLEETQIPTNADLVLTLSAKEDMELPKQIVITLDKTIRDENIEDEEITEDKTEYVINTDGKDNPEGFEFDAESGELTISSELLEGVREITIADTEENEADKDDEKATLNFEVKNLTFDFTDDEIVTDEDVVITFTAGEGYELPETIIITIDGEEYIIYTSEEDSDKNPDGITFDIETGTLTISKDLLSDAESITIAAEGVEKEDEESNEENPDADKKDESEDKDKDNTDKENGAESGETADKETEGGTDTPNTDDKTETEGGTDTPDGENTEVTPPETNPDNTTEGENNEDNNGENEGETEPPKSDTEVTTPTTPGTEDNTNTEQDGENTETGENNEGSTENGTEETIPDTEGNVDDETTIPTEPTTPAEPSEAAVSPETPKTETPGTSEPTTGGNDDGNGETESADSSSTESSNSGNDSTDSGALSESTTSTTPSVTPSAPTTSAPASSETSTPSASTQASSNTSSTSASSTPSPSTNSNTNGASQSSGATTPSGSKETSSEE